MVKEKLLNKNNQIIANPEEVIVTVDEKRFEEVILTGDISKLFDDDQEVTLTDYENISLFHPTKAMVLASSGLLLVGISIVIFFLKLSFVV